MMTAAEPCDLLIAHGVILTADAAGRVYRDGAVAIRGGRIVAVDDSSALQSRFAATETIDARDGLVHPGFIDAHIHVSQYTSRSVLPLMAGTSVTMGDWKAALTPEDEHASARLAAVDYLRAGYTGFVDPGTIFALDAVAAVADEIGIRIPPHD
jgi:cytosine/adenosine deaminase-related metal-dependent hydrolase